MRYEIVSETEVIDHQTGLIWQREIAENLTYEQDLEYAERVAEETGLPWRVPTVDELASLVDRGRYAPASAFPDMPSDWFWSSSPYVGDASYAWVVNFSNGYVNSLNRNYDFAVRLVRCGE
jgi:hypothetical protein